MKKFFAGLLTGLILTTTTFAFAADPIKLVVNGQQIAFPEAPPQIINGRTMVPARPLAEALGAKVDWDNDTRTVFVISNTEIQPPDSSSSLDTGSLISYKEISNIPGVEMVASEGKTSFKKGDIELIIYHPAASDYFNVDVLKNGGKVSETKAQSINGRTYLPKSVLVEYGFIE